MKNQTNNIDKKIQKLRDKSYKAKDIANEIEQLNIIIELLSINKIKQIIIEYTIENTKTFKKSTERYQRTHLVLKNKDLNKFTPTKQQFKEMKELKIKELNKLIN